MSSLSFSYDHPTFVSETFTGNNEVQVSFDKEAMNLVHVDTRMGEEDTWRKLRSFVIGTKNTFSLTGSVSGQQYRLRCALRPVSCDITAISSSGGSSSIGDIPVDVNEDGEVNTLKEVVDAFGGFPEGTTIKEALDEIEGGGLTEEDLENIFFPDGDAPESTDTTEESETSETQESSSGEGAGDGE
ncbi:MAG: hypothetical protein K6F89_06340 [Prevotella sp.]|nr:hypothetical protein [Prevotella sp.]